MNEIMNTLSDENIRAILAKLVATKSYSVLSDDDENLLRQFACPPILPNHASDKKSLWQLQRTSAIEMMELDIPTTFGLENELQDFLSEMGVVAATQYTSVGLLSIPISESQTILNVEKRCRSNSFIHRTLGVLLAERIGIRTVTPYLVENIKEESGFLFSETAHALIHLDVEAFRSFSAAFSLAMMKKIVFLRIKLAKEIQIFIVRTKY